MSFSEELVERLLDDFSQPGDLVLDPFAGFGTTLVVAERMGRHAIGVELLAERVVIARGRLADPSALHEHDARDLASLDLPAIDCSISSPPYMTRIDHPQNPLTGYATVDGEYGRYLVELRSVYLAVAELLGADGRIVVNVADTAAADDVTPLAADLAAALAPELRLVETIEVRQAPRPAWLVADYCLVFSRSR